MKVEVGQLWYSSPASFLVDARAGDFILVLDVNFYFTELLNLRTRRAYRFNPGDFRKYHRLASEVQS